MIGYCFSFPILIEKVLKPDFGLYFLDTVGDAFYSVLHLLGKYFKLNAFLRKPCKQRVLNFFLIAYACVILDQS